MSVMIRDGAQAPFPNFARREQDYEPLSLSGASALVDDYGVLRTCFKIQGTLPIALS